MDEIKSIYFVVAPKCKGRTPSMVRLAIDINLVLAHHDWWAGAPTF